MRDQETLNTVKAGKSLKKCLNERVILVLQKHKLIGIELKENLSLGKRGEIFTGYDNQSFDIMDDDKVAVFDWNNNLRIFKILVIGFKIQFEKLAETKVKGNEGVVEGGSDVVVCKKGQYVITTQMTYTTSNVSVHRLNEDSELSFVTSLDLRQQLVTFTTLNFVTYLDRGFVIAGKDDSSDSLISFFYNEEEKRLKKMDGLKADLREKKGIVKFVNSTEGALRGVSTNGGVYDFIYHF